MTTCDICKDDGRCLNNKKNSDYSEEDSDYLDCWVYLRRYVRTDRDYGVETWDSENKVWIKRDDSR